MIAAQGLLIQCLIGWQAHLFNLNGNASYAPKHLSALPSGSQLATKRQNCSLICPGSHISIRLTSEASGFVEVKDKVC